MSSKAHPRPYELLSAKSHKFKAALIPSRARAIYRRGSFGFLVLAPSAGANLHSSGCSIRNLRATIKVSRIAVERSSSAFSGKGVTITAEGVSKMRQVVLGYRERFILGISQADNRFGF
jgi:hypothetical protein